MQQTKAVRGQGMGRSSVGISKRNVTAASMPSHIQPMLATLSEMPVDESPYGFEYKWDGIRAVAFYSGKGLRIETRNLTDVTHSYPEIVSLADSLSPSSLILDGEIVAFDDHGRPSFGRLQHRLGLTEGHAIARQSEFPATYMIFDVIYLDGYLVTGLPYEERREVLEGLGLSGPNWQTPPFFKGEGVAVLEAARENRLEGIMAKRLTSTYKEGLRTRDWRKIKLVQRQEFVIGGWTPIRTGVNAMGALLLGYYDRMPSKRSGGKRARLVYAGKVGTGFSDRDRVALARAFEARARDTNPFEEPIPSGGNIHFIEPEMVAEVEYRGWTNMGHLRQPSFKGLRADKDPKQVVKEEAID